MSVSNEWYENMWDDFASIAGVGNLRHGKGLLTFEDIDIANGLKLLWKDVR